MNPAGGSFQVTDPGFALTSGLCADIGKFKTPALRGLAARAPYFHNGMSPTLMDVVIFYDSRFSIGFTEQEKLDLVAFHRWPTNRVWTRDYGPIFVWQLNNDRPRLTATVWRFNAWAKYPNWQADATIAPKIARRMNAVAAALRAEAKAPRADRELAILRATQLAHGDYQHEEHIPIAIDVANVHLFDPETGEPLR